MTETTETQAPEEQVNTSVGLSLNDLGAMIRVIDVCSKRGAFEGNELTQVGALRDRVVAFLEANAPQKPEGEGEENSEAEEKAAE